MTSQAKLDANRRNAQHSTGPRTPEGKAAASRNALKHGLTAQKIILFDETQEEFDAFCAELHADYAPADAAEGILVERIAVTNWRLRRVWRAEAAAFNAEAASTLRQRVRTAMHRDLADEIEKHPPNGKPVTRDEARRFAWAGIDALPEETLDETVRDEYPDPTLADANIWPRRLLDLSRHEAALERQLHRLVLDLDKVQQRRRERLAEAALMEEARLEAEERALAARRAAAAEAEKQSRDIAGHPMEPIIRRTNPKFAGPPPLKDEGEGATVAAADENP